MSNITSALTCCDGTGYTGNPRERCLEHFEPMGEGFWALSHDTRDHGDY